MRTQVSSSSDQALRGFPATEQSGSQVLSGMCALKYQYRNPFLLGVAEGHVVPRLSQARMLLTD